MYLHSFRLFVESIASSEEWKWFVISSNIIRGLIDSLFILTLFVWFFFLTFCFEQLLVWVFMFDRRIGWLDISSVLWFFSLNFQFVVFWHAFWYTYSSVWKAVLFLKLAHYSGRLFFWERLFLRLVTLVGPWAVIRYFSFLAWLRVYSVDWVQDISHRTLAYWFWTNYR